MGKIAIELNIPDEILKTIDLKRLKRIVEREVIVEYSVQKLHGKFRGMDLKKILREVEEEWGL
ncbi:hypothetical protein APY94_01945 [Thermococcus celericrescens]|uniref:Uncharacterized protein n=1 Tax=Thermococcus celericrescens TaxID=227598 RepID=A0A100XZE4_9EURY|nr:hypothetical protein [Thermococcus celericrescens]KUH34418.1 hypothetical protein APY94_01945 [Thermococcus celericrescens]